MTATPRWQKSSYSNNGGDCVELAANLAVTHGVVPVRDSKVPAGPVISLRIRAFAPFLAAVKGDAFTGA
ncbi:DUF397 domain-containing protein [Streptomyces sp. LP05-1]|uniref:DUF397 domain-containing protein n=1 Tax=Streptomyces pyxinae TaxID=2970734 RepID=A0ABT2CPK4_9ACTN|nr:DUF397 domain-containing protein [Streptomyces sp. LP05-1]MCS0639358.1 DUF397 domain-containing protein [Streptomyces sp. LP05-1]